MFDWTISFGNALTIIVLGAGGVGFVYTIRDKVESLSNRMESFERSVQKLVDILIEQGRQDERLNSVDARMLAQGARLDDLARQLQRFFEVRPQT